MRIFLVAVLLVASFSLSCGLGTANFTLKYDGGGPICPSCDGGLLYPSFACSYNNRGNWTDGIKVFDDPLPLLTVLIGVQLTLVGTFDCQVFSENTSVSITLQGYTVVNKFNLPQNYPCYCGNCAGTATLQSDEEKKGWPNYEYRGNNTLQIFVLENSICLSEVRVTLIHDRKIPHF